MFRVLLNTAVGVLKIEAEVLVNHVGVIGAIKLKKATTLDGSVLYPIGGLLNEIVDQVHSLAMEAQYFQEFERGIENTIAKYDDIS